MNQPHANHRRCRGFTIVEAIVATAILTVGVVSLTGVAANSVRLHQSGQKKSMALRTLDAQVATIESTPFANLSALDGTTFAADASIATTVANGSVGGGNSTSDGVLVVTAPTGDPAALLEITVALTWQGLNGTQVMQRRIRRSALGG